VSATAPKSKQAATGSAASEVTPRELIERARSLRPKLVDAQAEAEARTYYSEEMHEEFKQAGFYRMFVPRRYGGLEVGVPTFMRVVVELARGCPGTAWCLALSSNHALMVSSWFSEQTQDEVFEGGKFICASVAAPLEGLAAPVDGGWELNGKVSYCSGIPYSSYFMGQALTPGEQPGVPGPMLLYIAPRGAWRMLDDWGELLGLQASGSQSILFENGRIPARYVVENTAMVDIDVSKMPGYRVHENPMYGGRALSIFTMCLAAVLVGAGYNALDEYEVALNERKTATPPIKPRRDDPDFQRYFGAAWAKLATAEAALHDCAEQHMELCRRQADEGIPYSFRDDMLLGCIAREIMIQAWETVQSDLTRTIGASFLKAGQRMERIYRDMSIGNAHRNTSLRDWAFRELACLHLGVTTPSMLLRNAPSHKSQQSSS
jgi:3-hydroxy-9,10-secoandrosta-1,3,5(10)-triene-9,17-dione monooxygenase